MRAREMAVLLCPWLFCIVISAPAFSQTAEQASIAGRVTDTSGAVLPQAALLLRSEEKGFELHTTTDDHGEFLFSWLSPGTYTLTAELIGFSSTKLSGIRLDSFQKLEVPVVLQVGSLQTEVTVTSTSSVVDTASPVVHAALPQKAIAELPVMTGTASRAVLAQLQLMFPGASSRNFTGQGDAYGLSLSINGSATGGVGFFHDGIDNSYLLGSGGGSATVGPNPDALDEVSVRSLNYGVESGGHQSEVHLRTRSGGNRFHGLVRALQLNPDLGARDFFETTKGVQYSTNALGFNLSGPLVLPGLYDGHDRTFWFFDNEWTRSVWQQSYPGSLPTAAQRAGDFSGLPEKLWPIDPTTGKPFPEGRVPPGRIQPQARFYIDEFIPAASSTGETALVSDERPAGYQLTTRIDHRIGAMGTLSGSLFLQRNRDRWNLPSTVGTFGESDEHAYNLWLQYVRAFSGQATNAFTFGNTWWDYRNAQTGKYQDVDLMRQGYNIHNVNSGPHGYPIVFLDSNRFEPEGYLDTDHIAIYQWKDDFVVQRRRHGLKLGGDLRWSTGHVSNNEYCAPWYTFSAYNYAGSGNDLADFLLGIPSAYSQSTDSLSSGGRLMMSAYAQDDIKVRTGLTLNVGLRYEMNGALRDLNGRNGGFRPESRSLVYTNAPDGILFNGDFDPLAGKPMSDAVMPRDPTLFSPRAGLAWAPGFKDGLLRDLFGGPGKTSIRAGYGIYSILSLSTPQGYAANIPPWLTSVWRDRSMLDAAGGSLADPWGKDHDPFATPLTQRDFFLPLQNVPYVEPDLRGPSQQQWSLSVQRQLPHELIVEAAYLGSRSQHLLRGFSANPGLLTPNANLNNVQSRRAYPSFGDVKGFASDGDSVYHGLQLSAGRRFSQRVLFQAHYVWSKTMDNAGGIGASSAVVADRAATPWGRANSDRPHNFVGYWVAELPGYSRVPVLKHVISGW